MIILDMSPRNWQNHLATLTAYKYRVWKYEILVSYETAILVLFYGGLEESDYCDLA